MRLDMDPERENGSRGSVVPEFCFLECPVLVPAILWSLSRDRGSVERVLAGCPSDSDSEQASSFAMVLRDGLWERKGGMCQGRIHGGANKWCRHSAGPCAMRKISKPGVDSAFGTTVDTPQRPC